MEYARAAWERAMRLQEVMLKAIAGEIHWFQVFQIPPQPGRRSCAGLVVTVRQHLDGRYTITRGAVRLGTYGPEGQPVDAAASVDGRKEPRTPTRRLDRRHTPPTAHERQQASL